MKGNEAVVPSDMVSPCTNPAIKEVLKIRQKPLYEITQKVHETLVLVLTKRLLYPSLKIRAEIKGADGLLTLKIKVIYF